MSLEASRGKGGSLHRTPREPLLLQFRPGGMRGSESPDGMFFHWGTREGLHGPRAVTAARRSGVPRTGRPAGGEVNYAGGSIDPDVAGARASDQCTVEADQLTVCGDNLW